MKFLFQFFFPFFLHIIILEIDVFLFVSSYVRQFFKETSLLNILFQGFILIHVKVTNI